MTRPDELSDEAIEYAADLASHAQNSRLRIAVAESLTGGKIACHLGAAENSAEWFAGGVVAYTDDVKYNVLGVREGPVVSATAAAEMAEGVARLMNADAAVAVTGAGGPGPQEGQPAGTVFIGVYSPHAQRVEEHHFSGEPAEILDQTLARALRLLRDHAGQAVARHD